MCFGGSGGHQGGNSTPEDAETRKAFSKAGKTAAEARAYFRDRDAGKFAADAYLDTRVPTLDPRAKVDPSYRTDTTYGDVLEEQLAEKGLKLEGQSFVKYDDEGRRSTAGGINARGNFFGTDLGNLPSPNKLSQIARTGARDSKYGTNQQAFDEGTLDPKIERSIFDGVTYTPIGTVGMGNRVVYNKNAQYPGAPGLSFNPTTGRFDFDPEIGYTEDYQSIAGKLAGTVGPALVANMMGPAAPVAGAMIAYDRYKNKKPGVFSGIINKVLGRDSLSEAKDLYGKDMDLKEVMAEQIKRDQTIDVGSSYKDLPDGKMSEAGALRYFNFDNENDNDNNAFDQLMPPVNNDDEQSMYFNYRKYAPSDPTLIGQSSYGGKFGSGQPTYMASVSPAGIYSGSGPSAQVLTDFYNPVTGEYYTAPNAGYYAEEGSDWRRGRPTEAYNLPIAS